MVHSERTVQDPVGLHSAVYAETEPGAEPIEPVGHEHEFDHNYSLSFASTRCAALRIETLAQLSMQLASLPVPTPISAFV